MIVSQKKLAQMCGVSRRTIHRYTQQGMPCLGLMKGPGNPRMYLTEHARLWMARYAIKSNLPKG